MRTDAFQDALDDHAPLMLERQKRLGERIGGQTWRVDLVAGTLTFGADTVFTIQLLGTESQATGTWLAARANGASRLPGSLLRASRAVAAAGIDELSADQVVLDGVTGHELAMVATALAGGGAYYRGGYDGGAAYLLIEQELLDAPVAALAVATNFADALQRFDIRDHRRALRSYLSQRGFAVSADGTEGMHATAGTVRAAFDAHGRLARISG